MRSSCLFILSCRQEAWDQSRSLHSPAPIRVEIAAARHDPTIAADSRHGAIPDLRVLGAVAADRDRIAASPRAVVGDRPLALAATELEKRLALGGAIVEVVDAH